VVVNLPVPRHGAAVESSTQQSLDVAAATHGFSLATLRLPSLDYGVLWPSAKFFYRQDFRNADQANNTQPTTPAARVGEISDSCF
jgi:hypothetical protein